jgi:hypothetical protein
MSNIINTRSPFYIQAIPTSGLIGGAYLNLTVWAGEKVADKPASPQYIIQKDKVLAFNLINFEISELIRDFLKTEYYGVPQSIDGVWVEVELSLYDAAGTPTETQIFEYLSFDGFGYFPEGSNPRTSTDPLTVPTGNYTPMVLQSNTTVYFQNDNFIVIPIFSESQAVVTTTISGIWDLADYYWQDADFNWEATSLPQQITDSDNSLDKIQYLIIDSSNAQTGDTITVTSTAGNSQVVVITLEQISCGIYEDYQVIFYNKFGALQDFYMNKKSKQSLKVKNETYKNNIINYYEADYNKYLHQTRVYDVQGNQEVSLNSEFLKPEFNEVIKQLFLSEQVWLKVNNRTFPALLNERAFNEKTSVNDKLIQYGLTFNIASDTINNIR